MKLYARQFILSQNEIDVYSEMQYNLKLWRVCEINEIFTLMYSHHIYILDSQTRHVFF